MKYQASSTSTKIIVIGSNPSSASPDVSPFHPDTKSGQAISRWFGNLNVDLGLGNVSDRVTENNRPLRVGEIRESLPYLKQQLKGYNIIVAVGKTAAKALSMLEVDFFEMWHPSGLCRKWNDREAARAKLAELHKYIYERRQETDRPYQ